MGLSNLTNFPNISSPSSHHIILILTYNSQDFNTFALSTETSIPPSVYSLFYSSPYIERIEHLTFTLAYIHTLTQPGNTSIYTYMYIYDAHRSGRDRGMKRFATARLNLMKSIHTYTLACELYSTQLTNARKSFKHARAGGAFTPLACARAAASANGYERARAPSRPASAYTSCRPLDLYRLLISTRPSFVRVRSRAASEVS